MTAELTGTTGRIIDPEGVNHPKHYNLHPSGVECISVVERMSFNLGNCVKYVYRAGLKDVPLKDLAKALWYAEREAELVRTKGIVKPTLSSLWDRIIEHEPEPLRRRFYLKARTGNPSEIRGILREMIEEATPGE